MAFGPDQLLDFFSRGHRPRADWRLGLEYEQFITRPDGRPVPYSGPGGVEEIMRFLGARTGWKPGEERGRLLALRAPDGRALTLEPGAQIEFNTTPCRTVVEIDAQVREYFDLLRAARDEFGVWFLALGSQPMAGPDEIERLPKARYDILEPYLQAAGSLGVWMMKTTCGVQVNFDHSGPGDAAAKLRTAFALAPVFTALFSNSPLRAGEPSGFVSFRAHTWTATDPQRCGIPEACVRPESALQDFADWALAVPMLFIERQGALVDMRGRSFREYLQDGHGGHRATEADWELHLSTLFPEVRLRPQLELRSVDTQCPQEALALCALVKGLFYDPDSLDAAWELTAGWSHGERLEALDAAARHGLAAKVPGGGTMLALARELVSMAALPQDEQGYLKPLHELLAAGRSPGQVLLHKLETQWGGRIEALIQGVRCVPAGAPA